MKALNDHHFNFNEAHLTFRLFQKDSLQSLKNNFNQTDLMYRFVHVTGLTWAHLLKDCYEKYPNFSTKERKNP